MICSNQANCGTVLSMVGCGFVVHGCSNHKILPLLELMFSSFLDQDFCRCIKSESSKGGYQCPKIQLNFSHSDNHEYVRSVPKGGGGVKKLMFRSCVCKHRLHFCEIKSAMWFTVCRNGGLFYNIAVDHWLLTHLNRLHVDVFFSTVSVVALVNQLAFHTVLHNDVTDSKIEDLNVTADWSARRKVKGGGERIYIRLTSKVKTPVIRGKMWTVKAYSLSQYI